MQYFIETTDMLLNQRIQMNIQLTKEYFDKLIEKFKVPRHGHCKELMQEQLAT